MEVTRLGRHGDPSCCKATIPESVINGMFRHLRTLIFLPCTRVLEYRYLHLSTPKVSDDLNLTPELLREAVTPSPSQLSECPPAPRVNRRYLQPSMTRDFGRYYSSLYWPLVFHEKDNLAQRTFESETRRSTRVRYQQRYRTT